MQIRVYDVEASNYRTLHLNKFSKAQFDSISAGVTSVDALGYTFNVSAEYGALQFWAQGFNFSNLSEVAAVLDAAGFSGYTLSVVDSLNGGVGYTTDVTHTYQATPTQQYPYLQTEIKVLSGYNTSSATVRGQSASSGGLVRSDYYTYLKYCVFDTGNSYIYGVIQVASGQLILRFNNQVTSSSYINPGVEAGEPGFRPIGETASDPCGGGDTSGDDPAYYSAVMEQPGEPDETKASVKGTGFLNIYDITEANLANVGACLFGSTMMGFLANVLINPIDYILSLIIMPYIPYIGSSQNVKVGLWHCSDDPTDPKALGTNASAFPLSKQFRQLDFGTLTVPEMWKSFLDYDASSFSLYLPFIGTVDIPVGEVMDGCINVKYTLDFFTGTCVANVLCTKNVTTPAGKTYPYYSQHSYQGNCAIQIPVTSIGYGSMVGSIISAAASGMKGDVAGTIGGILNAKPTVETKGTISANAGYCSVRFPFITVERPITVEPANYQQVLGYPCYITSTLGECQGLCVCDEIDLTGVTGATDSELEKIRSMCKDGIYI